MHYVHISKVQNLAVEKYTDRVLDMSMGHFANDCNLQKNPVSILT